MAMWNNFSISDSQSPDSRAAQSIQDTTNFIMNNIMVTLLPAFTHAKKYVFTIIIR